MEVIKVIAIIIGLFSAFIILLKEERKMHENYLKNEIEKTKLIIEELQKK